VRGIGQRLGDLVFGPWAFGVRFLAAFMLAAFMLALSQVDLGAGLWNTLARLKLDM